jgi:glyoxylase-like metal-dependent hydrolase (beta-lactamase superfamily II)
MSHDGPKQLLRAVICALLAAFLVAAAAFSQTPSRPRQFETLTKSVGVYHDNVNVGVIRKNGRTLLIGSGEGGILDAAKALGLGPIDWVLYTDHHRDACSSAARLQHAGTKIAAPAGEADFFRNATEKWKEADKALYHRYYFRPDFFFLRSSVNPDRELQPGEVFQWQGLDIQAVATPGPTEGSVSYLLDVDGQRWAFTGDLIYGPGKLWNFYMLQKGFPGMPGDYWGWGGAAGDLVKSLDKVMSLQPQALIPAHGVIMHDPAGAVTQLKTNLHAAMTNFMTLAAWRIYFTGSYHSATKSSPGPEYEVAMLPTLPLPERPAWLHRVAGTSEYLQADDGSIFLLDCGFDPVLNDLKNLAKDGTIKGIEAMWISHYHDDHVQSVNAVRRQFGTKVYVQKEMQDILENPTAYSMPCLNPESIHVDHALAEGEVINWKGFKLTFYYFPGQTIYHDGVLVEHAGTRIFHTGDSFANFGIDDYCIYNRNFVGDEPGYEQCFKLLLRLQPDMLLASHWGLLPLSQDNLQRGLELLRQRRELYAALLAWEDPNFGLDPSWVRAYPYRQAVLPGQRVTLEARIYNHAGSSRQASVELRAPSGWQVQAAGPIMIPAHRERAIRFTAQAPANPAERREVLGLAVHFGGRDLGEMSEAIVDYLQ